MDKGKVEIKKIDPKKVRVQTQFDRAPASTNSTLVQVYDVIAPRTARLFHQCHQVLIRKSAQAAKSESVLPLLTQGIIQLMDVGSEIAKTRVEPFINELRESRSKH